MSVRILGGMVPRGVNHGRTRLFTRRERRRIGVAGLAMTLGLAGAIVVGAAGASWVSGAGWAWPAVHLRFTLAPPDTTSTGSGARSPRPAPVEITWPDGSPAVTAVIAALITACWAVVVVRPILRPLHRETRFDGLAGRADIRASLSAATTRRTGRFTRPGLSWWQRQIRHMSEFGIHCGYPVLPRGLRRLRLWVDFEQRIRIVGRPGWGKTARLLVGITRSLPGPALVSTMEPELFAQTVLARQFRRPRLRWLWLTLLLRKWLSTVEFPVAVVDFSPADNRWAAGFPPVHWSPIPGCDNPSIARRRAEALIHGVRQGTTTSQDDRFFHDSAADVLTAWLHAAALDRREIDDLIAWLQDTDDPVPRRILATHPSADKAAALAITTHLDKAAERTTSGVKRYLVLAVNSLASKDGRALIGDAGSDCIDLVEHIEKSGTIYVLADETMIDSARPLLGLFISEVYAAAQTAALRSRKKRLSIPFVGVHDELRYGPPVPRLPYVANTGRKWNIVPLYAVQAASQEVEAYGEEAAALRAAAGVTIIGGLDIDSAPELSDRAGLVPVVMASRSTTDAGESIQLQNVLTIADQQRLKDGDSVVAVRGLAPFLARTDSYRDSRRQRRRIDAEAAHVQRRVERENRRNAAWRTAVNAAGDAVHGFSDHTGGNQ